MKRRRKHSCTDLLTKYGSLQILNDDEICGNCLQFTILYVCLNVGGSGND